MQEALLLVARSAMVAFLLASMLDFGMSLSVQQILAPLRKAGL
jgi:hypothetical protein